MKRVKNIIQVVLGLFLFVCNTATAQNNEGSVREKELNEFSKETDNNAVINEVKVLRYTLNNEEPSFYNVELEVSYSGGYACGCDIEEDGNPCITNYYSKTKYYAKFLIKNVDSRSRAVAHITVYNSLGDVTVTVELDPSELYPTGISNKQIQDGEMNLFGSDSLYDIVLYDMKGQCVLKTKASQGVKTSSLAEGVYVMEIRDGKNMRFKRKIKL
mgnify:FL=1